MIDRSCPREKNHAPRVGSERGAHDSFLSSADSKTTRPYCRTERLINRAKTGMLPIRSCCFREETRTSSYAIFRIAVPNSVILSGINLGVRRDLWDAVDGPRVNWSSPRYEVNCARARKTNRDRDRRYGRKHALLDRGTRVNRSIQNGSPVCVLAFDRCCDFRGGPPFLGY